MSQHKAKRLTRKMRKQMKQRGIQPDANMKQIVARAESDLMTKLNTPDEAKLLLTKSRFSREINEGILKNSLNFDKEFIKLRGDLFRVVGFILLFLCLLLIGSYVDQKTGFLTNASRELVEFLHLSL